MAVAHDLAIFEKSLRAVLLPQININSQACDVSPYTNSYHHSRLKHFSESLILVYKSPWETVETFSSERIAPTFGLQCLTIARRWGAKYPSQREHWQLHGEVGDRWDQTQDFPKKDLDI